MIRVLNDEQSASFIEQNFKKGDILKWESYEGKKETEDAFLAITATSHECKEFDRDTVLDFNWIESFSLSDMAKLFGVGLVRVGSLSQDLVEKIDKCVADSILISPIYREKILQSAR